MRCIIYVALSAAAQEAMWLKQRMSELTTSNDQPITIFEDNQSAIAMTHNPQFHGRSKHIGIKHVQAGDIKLGILRNDR